MIDQLPEGKNIGWMQAPLQWIFTHTIRFIGIVHIVIQDGEGFILIKKGKPLHYYFRHGRIQLRGHAALDYFNSQPSIEFNLCKYTPEEFSQALKICDSMENQPDTPAPVSPKPKVRESPKPEAPVSPKSKVLESPKPEAPVSPKPKVPESPKAEAPVSAKPKVPESPKPEAPVSPYLKKDHEKMPVPPQTALGEADIKIISQIKNLNGIIAISVFNDERNLLLMGDVELEQLLEIANTMRATADTITPLLNWGSFVHMTLQIPDGNVILAPYRGNHLCLLTTRTINIGHIRRILRDLQQDSPG